MREEPIECFVEIHLAGIDQDEASVGASEERQAGINDRVGHDAPRFLRGRRLAACIDGVAQPQLLGS